MQHIGRKTTKSLLISKYFLKYRNITKKRTQKNRDILIALFEHVNMHVLPLIHVLILLFPRTFALCDMRMSLKTYLRFM